VLVLTLALTFAWMARGQRVFWTNTPMRRYLHLTPGRWVPWRDDVHMVDPYNDAVDMMVLMGDNLEDAHVETAKAFDLLEQEETEVRSLPIEDRQAAYEKLHTDAGMVRTMPGDTRVWEVPDDPVEQHWDARSRVWEADRQENSDHREKVINGAIRVYQLAASAGHVTAMIELAEVLIARCERTSKRVCGGNDRKLMNRMYHNAGLHYEHGKGISEKGVRIQLNLKRAIECFKMAAAGGYVLSQTRLDDLATDNYVATDNSWIDDLTGLTDDISPDRRH